MQYSSFTKNGLTTELSNNNKKDLLDGNCNPKKKAKREKECKTPA